MLVQSLNSHSSIKAVIWTSADTSSLFPCFVYLAYRMIVELHRKVSSLIEFLKQKWALHEVRIVSFFCLVCSVCCVLGAIPFQVHFCVGNVILPHKLSNACLVKVEVSMSASLMEPFIGNAVVFHFYLNSSLLWSPEKLVSNKWSSLPLFHFLEQCAQSVYCGWVTTVEAWIITDDFVSVSAKRLGTDLSACFVEFYQMKA